MDRFGARKIEITYPLNQLRTGLQLRSRIHVAITLSTKKMLNIEVIKQTYMLRALAQSLANTVPSKTA